MTEFETSNPPRDISIEEDTRHVYEELKEANDSPFKDAELNEMFVFAAAYGYNQGIRIGLDSRRALANRDSLGDEQIWILKSIALNEAEDDGILRDGRQIYTIVEEYAKGGIEQLQKQLDGPGDLYVDLSTEIIELHQSD